ncbi:MAG TPA: RHS repeat protein [Candidatus Hydrogenedentes bacterium]|nr:RHS repeat protein [Candidatus Hydrogenedentota bacterium]
MDRVIETDDGVGTVTVAYFGDGQMSTVTDGNSHTWTYAYDTAGRLTSIVDPVTKYVKYFYNAYGQLTKVGAGARRTDCATGTTRADG